MNFFMLVLVSSLNDRKSLGHKANIDNPNANIICPPPPPPSSEPHFSRVCPKLTRTPPSHHIETGHPHTVKPVYKDPLMGYCSAFWSSPRWAPEGRTVLRSSTLWVHKEPISVKRNFQTSYLSVVIRTISSCHETNIQLCWMGWVDRNQTDPGNGPFIRNWLNDIYQWPQFRLLLKTFRPVYVPLGA